MPPPQHPTAARQFRVPLPILAGFLVALFATFVITYVNYVSSETRSVAVQDMERTTQAIRAINEVLAAVKDAETGQRGFLITGDVNYLQPYQTAIASLDRRLSTLKTLMGGDVQDQERTQQLSELVHQKLQELDHTIELYKSGRNEAAIASVRMDTGKSIMDNIRQLASDMLDRQDQLFEARRRTSRWRPRAQSWRPPRVRRCRRQARPPSTFGARA